MAIGPFPLLRAFAHRFDILSSAQRQDNLSKQQGRAGSRLPGSPKAHEKPGMSPGKKGRRSSLLYPIRWLGREIGAGESR